MLFVEKESMTALKRALVPGRSTAPRRVIGIAVHAMRTKRASVVTYATVPAVALFSVTPRELPSPALSVIVSTWANANVPVWSIFRNLNGESPDAVKKLVLSIAGK
jgi:hypothetical protein